MRRWGLLRMLLLVTLGMSLVITVVHAKLDDLGEDDEDIWEDIEDDEEPAVSSTSRVSHSALVQLNDQNSEKIIKSNEYVMLLGYASWCRQSAAAMVDYAQASLTLKSKGSRVVLARIDAIVNTVTAGRYKIKGYPTVLFFRNGSEEVYPAGLSTEEIVNWIQKQTGHPTTTISTKDEAMEILQRKNTAVLVGYFVDFEGSEYEDFVAASIEVADVEFVQSSVAEVAGFFKAEMAHKVPSIGLFDSEDGFEQMEGPLTKDAIVEFANLYKYPLVTKLHSRNVGKVYSSPIKKQVLLFASEDDFEDVYDLYKSAALTFKNKLMFVWVDTADEDFAKPMLTMYGIPDSEAVVAGFDNGNGLRYLMDAEVTKENLIPWAQKYLEGQLDLHFKSERIPKENSEDVKVVVGKTFTSMVLDRTTDVVLLVYTPYCNDCDSMGKVFLKVAKHFKGNSSLFFGKIDASANEHPAFKVSNFPAILFYSVDSGSEEPVKGPSKPYFKKLIKFMEEQLQLRSSAKSDIMKETMETTPEVPNEHDSAIASHETGVDSLKVLDGDSMLTETILEVSRGKASEVNLWVETETPAGITDPAEAVIPDSPRVEGRAVEGDKETEDLSRYVSTEAPLADSSTAEIRAVKENREVENSIRDETSYKDEL